MCFIMKKKLFLHCWLLTFLLVSISFADVQVRDVSVKPHYPWNGLVDITYSILCGETDDKGEQLDVYVAFMGYDTVLKKNVSMTSLTGQGATAPLKTGGPYTVTWNAAKDYPTLNSSGFQVKIHATVNTYMVVDLSGGPNAEKYPVRYTKTPPDLDDDTCRTTELWLRRIPAGTFLMGSPEDELGRKIDEVLHEVTLTDMYFIGIFELTQKQYEIIMGTNPSYHRGDCRPVDMVSYDMIRGTGTKAGAGWPKYGHTVDESSFMGILQAKTGLTFDLPTEAQWEYACRAGTTTAVNSGKNLESISSDANMAEVARYGYNNAGRPHYAPGDGKGGYSSQSTKVGSYLSNVWGIYDMHGNVYEWCLDWYASYGTEAVVNPVGPIQPGPVRIARGGSWYDEAHQCRAANRDDDIVNFNGPPSARYDNLGFRIVCLPKFDDLLK